MALFDEAVETLSESNINQVEIAKGIDGAAAEAIAPEPGTSAVVDNQMDSAAVERALVTTAIPAAEAAPEGEGEPAPVEQPKQQPSRAQQRIMQLNEARKRAEQETARVRAEADQRFRQLEQQQAEDRKRLLELEEKRLRIEEARRTREEEASLSDADKLRRNFERDVVAKAKAELAGDVEAAKAELAALRAEREAERQQKEQEERYSMLSQQAKTVIERDLMAGYDPEDAKALGEVMDEMLLSYSAAFGMYPVQAAKQFKEFIQRVTRAENKKVARAGQRIAHGRTAPQPLPAARTGAPASTSLSEIKLTDLRANGFDSHVSWIKAGHPALSKRP